MPDAASDFARQATRERTFAVAQRRLWGTLPTIAITPVADGRSGAYEANQNATWAMAERVYTLLARKVRLADGCAPRIVTAPEIVYGARSAARAQEHYTREGVSINIFVSRSWAYSDELMPVCMGIGSSEWIQAAYGLNQTDRPGAVWLKAFTAAMDEKKRPIFAIYNPDLESEEGECTPYVASRLLRFARAACVVAQMRGKNYLSIGGVSMGIIGSDVRRNIFHHSFGMGTVSTDMTEVRARLDRGFYDHDELAKACAFFNQKCSLQYGSGKRPMPADKLLEECLAMTLIVRDLMIGNPVLASKSKGKRQGFTADVEAAQGAHAIAAGTQGQRQWTDYHPNFDLTEALLCSMFDWNGIREPLVLATENDAKNAAGMLVAHLLTGLPQLFADIRTNWTVASIKKATGKDISLLAAGGIIDKRNSGAGALEYGTDIYNVAGMPKSASIYDVAEKIRSSKSIGNKLIAEALARVTFHGANLEYFPGDGLSSSFRTPGGQPMTAYRYNVVGDEITFSVVEGETVELPAAIANHISRVTDATWPETYWAPNGMSSFEYMSRMGPNHDANSFGSLGADLITLNAMLRIPVDLHNVPSAELFRPTLWDRYGNDDFRVCEKLGPLYR